MKVEKNRNKWIVETESYALFHNEIDDCVRAIKEEIDWDIECKLLALEVGWVIVHVQEFKTPEMTEWCTNNLSGRYKNGFRTWIFEKEKDAAHFLLRWG